MTIFVKEKFIWLKVNGEEDQKLTPELYLAEEQAQKVCSFLGGLHPLFGDQDHELDELYSPFYGQGNNFSEEAVLFPGSFSPWHEGHEACISGQEQGPVVIIPDFNPWKEVRQDSTWNELRTLWLFAGKRKRVSLFSGFLGKGEKNPTASWLPDLVVKKKWLLMGDDSFLSLNQWKDVDVLVDSLEGILVCPRQGLEAALSQQAKQLSTGRTIDIRFLPPHPFQDISSTQLRNSK